MEQEIIINLPIESHEVPNLRELVGWDGRHTDYPMLFERCNFWEDIMVHPQFQKQGIGQALVKNLLQEAERIGLEIVTLTFDSKHTSFYTVSGFSPCSGGLWRRKD